VSIKPIRTAEDLKNAKERVRKLIQRSASGENDDEIDVLSALIEQFEQNYFPIGTPTPVAAIRFRMEELGLTPRQLEPFIGSRARVSEVLSGKRQLSIDMIRSLHEGLGIPYESLISDRSSGGTGQFPASAIYRLKALGFDIDRRRIRSFISSSLDQSAPAALLRKTSTQRAASKTDQAALLLWQAAVLKKSETLPQTGTFDPSRFGPRDLRQVAKLSTKADGPRRAIRELTSKGIALIIVPPLPGTFLDGAAMLSSAGKPVIGLTLRYDRIDSFWFTLLHELAHLTLHYDDLTDSKTVFIDDMEIQSDDMREREADALARDSLIPSDVLKEFGWGGATTYDDLVAIATRARVHIAVVAGRWQRDHQNYKKFARLIERNTVRSMLAGVGK
jgi:HTH-type transcriptional regulator / antitoxin HigA